MSPLTPICCASLFDKEMGIDGDMYIAKMIDGKLSWVKCNTSSTCQTSKKVMINRDRIQIKKNMPHGFPLTPIEHASQYDTELGTDGNEYIAQSINGKLVWMLQDKASNSNSTKVIKVNLPKDNSRRRTKMSTYMQS
jgi:hypothetical protein